MDGLIIEQDINHEINTKNIKIIKIEKWKVKIHVIILEEKLQKQSYFADSIILLLLYSEEQGSGL